MKKGLVVCQSTVPDSQSQLTSVVHCNVNQEFRGNEISNNELNQGCVWYSF